MWPALWFVCHRHNKVLLHHPQLCCWCNTDERAAYWTSSREAQAAAADHTAGAVAFNNIAPPDRSLAKLAVGAASAGNVTGLCNILQRMHDPAVLSDHGCIKSMYEAAIRRGHVRVVEVLMNAPTPWGLQRPISEPQSGSAGAAASAAAGGSTVFQRHNDLAVRFCSMACMAGHADLAGTILWKAMDWSSYTHLPYWYAWRHNVFAKASADSYVFAFHSLEPALLQGIWAALDRFDQQQHSEEGSSIPAGSNHHSDFDVDNVQQLYDHISSTLEGLPPSQFELYEVFNGKGFQAGYMDVLTMAGSPDYVWGFLELCQRMNWAS